MESTEKNIKLVDHRDEVLATGRKLLHLVFQDRYGTRRYRWTVPWRDKEQEKGMLSAFQTALQVEEWNDYDSVWGDELRNLAGEVAELQDLDLPVSVRIGNVQEGFVGPEDDFDLGWGIEVLIVGKSLPVYLHDDYITVGPVMMWWLPFRGGVSNVDGVCHVSQKPEERLTLDPEASAQASSQSGVRFWVWVKQAKDTASYRSLCRDVVAAIRHYIRISLADYRQMRKGFQDYEQRDRSAE